MKVEKGAAMEKQMAGASKALEMEKKMGGASKALENPSQ